MCIALAQEIACSFCLLKGVLSYSVSKMRRNFPFCFISLNTRRMYSLRQIIFIWKKFTSWVPVYIYVRNIMFRGLRLFLSKLCISWIFIRSCSLLSTLSPFHIPRVQTYSDSIKLKKKIVFTTILQTCFPLSELPPSFIHTRAEHIKHRNCVVSTVLHFGRSSSDSWPTKICHDHFLPPPSQLIFQNFHPI